VLPIQSPYIQAPGGEMESEGLEPTSSISGDHAVRFGDYRYTVHVRSVSDSWREFADRLARLDTDRVVLIVDDRLPSHLLDLVIESAQRLLPVDIVKYAADERRKNLVSLNGLAETALGFGVTRSSVIVAVGGGVVGNVAGLLAALLFRGLRLVQVPTTLLGMSDSVLSLKQAVNSRLGKNHLGAYLAPEFVWNYLPFVDTLPSIEVRSALCEMVKNVLAICPECYDDVAALLRVDGRYDYRTLAEFVEICVRAKCSVMGRDAYERREALVLEYGHTVGHAAELLTGGDLAHGFAVGIGMVVAARVAARLGYLTDACVYRHIDLLERNGAPTRVADLTVDEIIGVISHDNKRGYVLARPGYHGMVLLDELGRPHREGGSLITMVPETVLREALVESAAQSSTTTTVYRPLRALAANLRTVPAPGNDEE
jgi:3-dehydroquinate synthetase